uniref:Uncharacterized protein n=1 Tax=Anguilla anguilla TaxID=7936 RepID=A0A0E9UUB2_ANGAN
MILQSPGVKSSSLANVPLPNNVRVLKLSPFKHYWS